MRATVSLFVFLFLLPSLATCDDKQDNAPFQGKWKIVSIVANGEDVALEQFAKVVVTVTGDERVLRDGEEVKSRAKYKVDVRKSPKAIDLTITEGPLKGRTLKGIYEFQGDTVTINVAMEGEGRPEDFSCKTGSNRLLQKFKRVPGGAK